MEKTFRRYLFLLYEDVPDKIYLLAIFIFLIGNIFIFGINRIKGIRFRIKYSITFILTEYLSVLYGSTVFFRNANDVRKYNYRPFWSYYAFQEGESQLFPEIIMNVVAFIPVGFFLGISLNIASCKKVFLIGLLISISIETLQLLLCRGFSELDDIMHNTIGCIIGYQFYYISKRLWSCFLRF